MGHIQPHRGGAHSTTFRGGKSRIFTETPEKNRLEEIERERERRKELQNERNKKRVMKQVFSACKKTKMGPKNSRKLSVSSSDTDESIVVESDDISDEFSEPENEHLITDDDVIQQNDFVLVKFPLKTNVFYYVGQVIEIIN